MRVVALSWVQKRPSSPVYEYQHDICTIRMNPRTLQWADALLWAVFCLLLRLKWAGSLAKSSTAGMPGCIWVMDFTKRTHGTMRISEPKHALHKDPHPCVCAGTPVCLNWGPRDIWTKNLSALFTRPISTLASAFLWRVSRQTRYHPYVETQCMHVFVRTCAVWILRHALFCISHWCIPRKLCLLFYYGNFA